MSVTSTSWQARLRQCLLLGSQRRRSSCCTACSSRSARAGTASVRRGWSRSRSGSCGSPGSRAGSSALRRGPLCTPGRRRRRCQTTCSVRLGARRAAAAATHRAACEVLTSIGNAGLLEDEPHKVFDTVNITVKCVLPTGAQRCTVHSQQAGRVKEPLPLRAPPNLEERARRLRCAGPAAAAAGRWWPRARAGRSGTSSTARAAARPSRSSCRRPRRPTAPRARPSCARPARPTPAHPLHLPRPCRLCVVPAAVWQSAAEGGVPGRAWSGRGRLAQGRRAVGRG